MKPVFGNKENEEVVLPDGRTVWLSRASTVNMTLLALVDGRHYVAMGKRGPKTPDFQGLWCLPCGYLDWNEDGYQAARRETYEEIGFDIETIPQDAIIAASLLTPWQVNTSPSQNLQNIALSYAIYFTATELPALTFDTSTGECTAVAWQPVDWVLANGHSIAFNHSKKVGHYCQHVGVEVPSTTTSMASAPAAP